MRRTRLALALLSLALLIAAVALGRGLQDDLREDPVKELAAGETLALVTTPYGREHTVKLPTLDVLLTVGDPLDSLDGVLAESSSPVQAKRGGSLVPLTWWVRLDEGVGFDDSKPIDLRLVAGDDTVDLDSIVLSDGAPDYAFLYAHSEAVALPGDVDLEDLRIEVEYDGLTQVLDPGTGDIAAGVAQALYEPDAHFDTGCTEIEDNCDYEAAETSTTLRPFLTRITSSYVSLYPYDDKLGWAEEGTLWAGVRLTSFKGYATDAAGTTIRIRRQSDLRVRLDGEKPVRVDGLGARRGTVRGRAIFKVATDARPTALRLDSDLTLTSGQKLPMTATLTLRPVEG